MWKLENRTSYAAERNWTRDKDGGHRWIVAVRATFDVDAGGRLSLADEQLPPTMVPEYHGEPGLSSLRYDSDLLWPKPSTDVLVLANAHAPRGRPVKTVPVTLRVGSLVKQLLVHGERAYYKGMLSVGMTDSQPFVEQPIIYERAFGGTDLSDENPDKHRFDERNPIGRGFSRKKSTLVNRPAPCIEYPKGKLSETGPAGFGPIDPSWTPRRQLAGTYDEAWERRRKPLLPDDYDPAFAMSAPADQRMPRPLAGGERIVLEHMTAAGQLVIELPEVHLRFETSFGSRTVEHGGQLATVLVESAENRLSMTWQSSLKVGLQDADYLDSTEIKEVRGVA